MVKRLVGADLFCGAGGTSTGMLKAATERGATMDLLAINHWPVAINTHSLNHPSVRHKCQSLDQIRPVEAVPGGMLDILAASPECTHHSCAAGGRPRNEQSRATAWHICSWASDLRVKNILMENVREFENWGPLNAEGKPIKKRKGETFNAFVHALEAMDYRVEYRIQNAAQYGDPTTRKRLILMARKGGKAIRWPDITHGPGLTPFRTAREIIDWDLKGQSIFNRKRPLSPKTIARIAAGLRKFGGAGAEPFLVMLYGTGTAASVNGPLPTVTAGGNLAEPFLVTCNHGEGQERRTHSMDDPIPTLCGSNSLAFVEPFILPHPRTKGDGPRSVDSPMGTITATSADMALVEPFITPLTHHGEDASRCKSVDEPLQTVTGAHRGELALVEPFLTHVTHTDERTHSINGPVPTITTAKGGELALVEPFVVKYYGTGISKSIDLPLDTIPTKDRFLLVEPVTGRVVAEMDIRLRMLQPHELAAAMSFPKEYRFYGTKENQVKQIGNAVPVELARAHADCLMDDLVID